MTTAREDAVKVLARTQPAARRIEIARSLSVVRPSAGPACGATGKPWLSEPRGRFEQHLSLACLEAEQEAF
jgi:hypothetical protein